MSGQTDKEGKSLTLLSDGVWEKKRWFWQHKYAVSICVTPVMERYVKEQHGTVSVPKIEHG